jgi:hypothetical protein
MIRKLLRKWLGIEDIESKLDPAYKMASIAESNINTCLERIYQTRQRVDRLDKLCSDLVNIGVDVNFKSPHMILIYTKLGGGQIHHIDADFKDLGALREFVGSLKARFHTDKATYDLPAGMSRYWVEED